jgi:hypothetical protein
MPTITNKMDSDRQSVLDRMERHNSNVRLAMIAAAALELAFIALAVLRIDFTKRFEVLVFVFFIMTYSIVILGLVALGAHVSRVGDRVLAAMQQPVGS